MDLRTYLAEIEAAAVRGWPAIETAEIHGWLWRHSYGGSTRANAVATLAFDGGDVDAAIDAVERRYRAAGAPAQITVSAVSVPADLDARLERRGYQLGESSLTMAKRVDVATAMPANVACAAEPSAEWLGIYLSGLSDLRRAKAPPILARLPAGTRYLAAQHDGRMITSGLTIADGRVASVQCMATSPDARRQGGARRVLQAIEHLAARHGQTVLYLQTEAANNVAQSLYKTIGFAEAGRYHTWLACGQT